MNSASKNACAGFAANMLRGLVVFALCFWGSIASAQEMKGAGANPREDKPSPLAQANPGALDFPFINLVKAGHLESWQAGTGAAGFDPSEFDSNGYPLYNAKAASAPPVGFNGWTLKVPIPQQYARPGNYVLTWSGAGDFEWVKESPTFANGSVIEVSCNGRGGTDGGFMAHCDNTRCNTQQEMRGYVVGDVLTITVSDNECKLVIGEPISGDSIAASKFGTPTIITADRTSGATACNGHACSGDGGRGTYRVNFSQNVGSTANPIAINPGGRLEFRITGEDLSASNGGTESILTFNLRSTGTPARPGNTAQSIALVYSCRRVGNCSDSNLDDETVYWTGQIAGTTFKRIYSRSVGVLRDLGFTNAVSNTLTTWASRMPAAYYSWGNTELRNSIYAGSQSSTGNPIKAESSLVSFTGRISGPTLTASSVTGSLAIGQYLDAAHIQGTISNGAGAAGNILNVTNFIDGGGALAVGEHLYDANGAISANTLITGSAANGATCGPSLCTGNGALGTYLVSHAQYVTAARLSNRGDASDFINVTNVGVPPRTTISANGTGSGGAGTYTLTTSANVASESMSLSVNRFFVSMDKSAPTDKETIIVKWQSNVGDPSASLFSADGGATYRPICNAAGVLYNTVRQTPVADLLGTLVYDSTLACWLHFGGAFSGIYGPMASQGLTNLLPPEAFIEICAELGVQPWIIEPFLASDPVTDYITQYALYIKNNYPNMVPQFETPNETWNGGPAGVVSIYARNKALGYGTLDSIWAAANHRPNSGARDLNLAEDWTGKVASLLCQAVSAVYRNDHTRYRCIVGVATFQDYNDPKDGNERLLSSAYVSQDVAKIPIQSGCAGPSTGPLAAVQFGCPIPFRQAPAYNWVTELAPTTYWGLAEPGLNPGAGNYYLSQGIQPATYKELIDAYQYFNGSTAQQSSIMASYLATANDPFVPGTLTNQMNIIWPPFYVASKTCAGQAVRCPGRGLAAYEGGFTNPPIPEDIQQIVTSATGTAGRACQLNTTQTVVGYINDGKGSSFFDREPGNIFSAKAVLPLYGTLTNVPGKPTIIGFANAEDWSNGYVISTSLYQPTASVIVAANGAVAGMKIKISRASGGAWSDTDGMTFIVGAHPSQSGIPLTIDGTTPFDCTTLGALGKLTLTYVGSANWINFLRNMSYVDPQMEAVQKQLYDAFYSLGGAGASQLGISGNNNAVGHGWMAMGNDIYGFFPVAKCTKCSIAGSFLTLGGNITGRFQSGQRLYGGGLSGGSSAVAITDRCVAAGPSVCGSNVGDKLSLSASANVTSQWINGTITSFPLVKGMEDYEAEHGGHPSSGRH